MTIYHWIREYNKNILETIENVNEEIIEISGMFQQEALSILEL